MATPTPKHPDAGKPATIGSPAPKKGKTTRFSGESLMPNIGEHRHNAGVTKEFRYWVGVMPSCPVESLDLAGINFPKVNEKLIADPLRTHKKKRKPVVGALVWLTETKIRAMIERLPRTIIRFTDDPGQHEEPGTGQNIGDVAVRPRKGHVVTIPTAKDVAARRAKNKAVNTYTPRDGDEPAGRYMFAVLCEDQDNPERGDYYPDPIETTGIEWPDNLEAVADLLS